MAQILQRVLWLFMVAVMISAQRTFKTTGLRPQCLGNVMRLTIDKSFTLGGHLEVAAFNGSHYYPITPSMAPTCGYRKTVDPWGNVKLFASVLSCHTQNQDDEDFNMKVRVTINSEQKADKADMHEVSRTCKYNQWASREILCDADFMEVSVNRLPPPVDRAVHPEMEEDRWAAIPEAVTSKKSIWRMVFFTPREKSLLLTEAQKLGYFVASTPTRLVIRSRPNTTEIYTENVAGISMNVLRVTTYFKDLWSVTMLDSAAACPTSGLTFTEKTITWSVPRHIHPLLTTNTCETLEVHMGIDGEQLDESQLLSKGYTMSVTDSLIIIELPVGGPDGYYKSHVSQYQYHILYSIEAMVVIVWKEAGSDLLTKYKVLYPITTPLMPRPPHVIANAVPEERVFDVVLGTFHQDVILMNITFSTGVLTVVEANARGFNVQEIRFPNGSKTFSLRVPFSDPVVLKSSPKRELTTYTLSLIFGLVVLPEPSPFSHPAALDVTLQDVVFPVVTGTCDDENYYITVAHEGHGNDFKYIVGKRELTGDLASDYNVRVNATHMTMRVSFLSSDAVFTFVIPTAAGGRLDFKVNDPVNKWTLTDFSLACTFPMPLTECHPNGTMTALALKVESAPNVIPSQLTLIDKSCKPVFSNDRFASFSFTVNTCGTARMFLDDFMIYQNHITMPNQGVKNGKTGSQPEYRLTISCYYVNDDLKIIPFVPKARGIDEDLTQIGTGAMRIRMRLARDFYNTFYSEENYPVVEYLRRPLYFEVELMDSTDPELELFVESCWATLTNDRQSTPRWDLIVDGCPNQDDRYMATMHPVTADDRVQFPSHFKRFDMKMFSFVQDNVVLRDQIHVHCDAAICDRNRQSDGFCYRQCSSHPDNQPSNFKSRQSNAKFSPRSRAQLSSGRILVSK
ncbi:uncharacterized protein LOC121711502 [Alosa sapidissima]|uniref:uncharacterized protein LOC121711502 n=1 Tax=Alosa sapidissima TaxID=34773 RepID=UPI001C0A5942|nr:uncharacterized protein LOC121711502 [Alosa sapidissima]